MTTDPNVNGLAMLRKPFEPGQIGKLPKVTDKESAKSRCAECKGWLPTHIHLDYVGHADVTDRLLNVDPTWSWEPVAFDTDGSPLVRIYNNDAALWIRLTILGITRLGVGIAPKGTFELPKQLIGDAIRNAAMRFGVALDLWAKGDLAHPEPIAEPEAATPAGPTLRERSLAAALIICDKNRDDARAYVDEVRLAVCGGEDRRPTDDEALAIVTRLEAEATRHAAAMRAAGATPATTA